VSVSAMVELDGALFVAPNPYGARAHGGVYRSDDGGGHFRPSSRGLPRHGSPNRQVEPGAWLGPYVVVSALGLDGTTLLAGTVTHRIFRSVDQGESWAPARGLPEAKTQSPIGDRVEEFATVKSRVYARTGQGLFVSSDHGETWSKTAFTSERGAESFPQSIAADPRGTLYAGVPDGVLASEDDGASFRFTVLRVPARRLLTHENVLYVLSDRVLSSHDRGKTFRDLGRKKGEFSDGQDLLAVYGLTLPGDDSASRGLRYSLENTRQIGELRSGALAIATMDGLLTTADAGQSFRAAQSGPAANGVVRLVTTGSQLIAVAKETRNRPFASPLDGSNFRPLGYGGNEALALASRGNSVWIGDEQGRLFRSDDEAATFTRVTLPAGLPEGPVELVAWSGDRLLIVRGGILVSRDAGATFEDLRAGIPIEPEKRLEGGFQYGLTSGVVTEHALLLGGPSGILRRPVDRDWATVKLSDVMGAVVSVASDGARVYAATSTELYASDDEGQTFERLLGPLPFGLSVVGVGAAQGEVSLAAVNDAAQLPERGIAILLSTDRGRTWTSASKGLDVLPISAPVRGPNAWYVGLEFTGVWSYAHTGAPPVHSQNPVNPVPAGGTTSVTSATYGGSN
jgi:photosystem II stability/assembly factor-like uncharacterized protein